ncbi:hypothetical protein DUNSADRAFT_75 [Dunaliella salina]|uniref:Uncharacterized protein n=1 Tax=Dunaliella salina TaxID=3046 RepID=A0ABQ7H8T9_DUNSA|nr:hypothetical protein DUNSADRAFT_75 [Dunaliella salina]|eukprot:KAF5843273.1 hypothetical protein DUNSADRAFT_75 [Dunaliella salina]
MSSLCAADELALLCRSAYRECGFAQEDPQLPGRY